MYTFAIAKNLLSDTTINGEDILTFRANASISSQLHHISQKNE